MTRVVIIGAGQGRLQVAMSLRQQRFEDEVAVAGDAPGLPYERLPLSKVYTKDDDGDALAIRPPSWFERNGIDLRSGTRIASIDRDVSCVMTDRSAALDYDHLVTATGARNARPPMDGLDRPGVVPNQPIVHMAARKVLSRPARPTGADLQAVDFDLRAYAKGAT